MSNYYNLTKNPKTGDWENAEWLENYFGHHNYGVGFPDGKVYDPAKTELETKDPPEVEPLEPEAQLDESLDDELKKVFLGLHYDWYHEYSEHRFEVGRNQASILEGIWLKHRKKINVYLLTHYIPKDQLKKLLEPEPTHGTLTSSDPDKAFGVGYRNQLRRDLRNKLNV